MTGAESTDLLTLAEAAARLKVDPKTMRRYIASGRVTAYRLGPSLLRIDPAEVDKLLHRVPTARSSSRCAQPTVRRGALLHLKPITEGGTARS